MICKKCAKRDSFEAISRAAKLTSQVANVRQSRRYDSYQKLPLCGPGPGGIDYAARARWRGAVPGCRCGIRYARCCVGKISVISLDRGEVATS